MSNYQEQLTHARQQSLKFAIGSAVLNLCVAILGGLAASPLVDREKDRAILGLVVVVVAALHTFAQALKSILETETKIQDNAKAVAVQEFVQKLKKTHVERPELISDPNGVAASMKPGVPPQLAEVMPPSQPPPNFDADRLDALLDNQALIYQHHLHGAQ